MAKSITEELQAERAGLVVVQTRAQAEREKLLKADAPDKAIDAIEQEIAGYTRKIARLDARFDAAAQADSEAEATRRQTEQVANEKRAHDLKQQLDGIDDELETAVVALHQVLTRRNDLAGQTRHAQVKAIRPSFPTLESWAAHAHALQLADTVPVDRIADRLRMMSQNVPDIPAHLIFGRGASE